MLADYLTLYLEPTATDEQIRERYLDLIKSHPPELDPLLFQDITRAYERIKDKHARIHDRLFGDQTSRDIEASFSYLLRAAQPRRKRAGLQSLLKAARRS